jgi:hypothetical protein
MVAVVATLWRALVGRDFSFEIRKLLFSCELKSDRLPVQRQFFRGFVVRRAVCSDGAR